MSHELVPDPCSRTSDTDQSLVPVAAPLIRCAQQVSIDDLVNAFLSGRSEHTIRAYQRDLLDFSRFIGAKTAEQAAATLLSSGHGQANAVALAYRTHLVDRGLAPATVNRRLAAVRSLVKLARTLGMVPWTLEVPSVKSQPYRDTRGPGRLGLRLLLDQLADRHDAKAQRDRALLRLLHDLALRRGEVVGLDVDDVDVDLEAAAVAVLGKGRRERVKVTLPDRTKAALAAWLEVRPRQ